MTLNTTLQDVEIYLDKHNHKKKSTLMNNIATRCAFHHAHAEELGSLYNRLNDCAHHLSMVQGIDAALRRKEDQHDLQISIASSVQQAVLQEIQGLQEYGQGTVQMVKALMADIAECQVSIADLMSFGQM